jgi:hypothetical protein
MARSKRKRLTPEQRRERIDAAHQRLSKAVEELMTADGWKNMINARRWLRRYSFHNLLMITEQCPHARDVRPLSEWNELGRHVRKGERAIRIWAPRFRRVHDTDTDTAADGGETTDNADHGDAQGGGRSDDAAGMRRQLYGFILVNVFDVSQTDGDPLPEVARPAPELLHGDAPAWLWQQVAAQISAQGYRIERGDCDDANGTTIWEQRLVRVRDDVEPAQAVKTLTHELAHILCGHEHHDAPKPFREVEAESVACIVVAVAGLDSLPYSVPYVAGWAPDRDTVCASAQRVLAVADTILAGVQVPDSSAQATPTAYADTEQIPAAA